MSATEEPSFPNFAEFAKAILRVKRGEQPPATQTRPASICMKAIKCNNIECPHIGIHEENPHCRGMFCEAIGEDVSCIGAIRELRMICTKAIRCPNEHCSEREPHVWSNKCFKGKCKISVGDVKCILAKPDRVRSKPDDRLKRKIQI